MVLVARSIRHRSTLFRRTTIKNIFFFIYIVSLAPVTDKIDTHAVCVCVSVLCSSWIQPLWTPSEYNRKILVLRRMFCSAARSRSSSFSASKLLVSKTTIFPFALLDVRSSWRWALADLCMRTYRKSHQTIAYNNATDTETEVVVGCWYNDVPDGVVRWHFWHKHPLSHTQHQHVIVIIAVSQLTTFETKIRINEGSAREYSCVWVCVVSASTLFSTKRMTF